MREDSLQKTRCNQYCTNSTAATIQENYSGLLPGSGTFILDSIYVGQFCLPPSDVFELFWPAVSHPMM